MKKLILLATSVFLLSVSIPTNLKADTQPKPITTSTSENVDKEKAAVLIVRLEQIKAMDISSMNFTEKREMRKEVRSIKGQLNDLGGGIYISVGAIIIILLLLILLF
jgi:hypothetical protein